MIDRASLIRTRLAEGKMLKTIAMELGVSKQYVHQIVKELGIPRPMPEEYITIDQLAAKLGVSYRRAQQDALEMPSLKWGKRRLVKNTVPRPCRRCGRYRGRGTRYCDTCAPKARAEAHKRCMWRRFHRKQGRKIPRSLRLEKEMSNARREGNIRPEI